MTFTLSGLIVLLVIAETGAASMQTKSERAHILLESPVLRPNAPIPRKYTGQGDNVSPPLKWSHLPADTKEIVVVLEDRDTTFPRDDVFLQWMVYRIPGTAKGLPEHLPEAPIVVGVAPDLPEAFQARTHYDVVGYRGPQPREGELHHYRFVIYALDAKLDLKPGTFANTVLDEIRTHIIGEGEIRATYRRTP